MDTIRSLSAHFFILQIIADTMSSEKYIWYIGVYGRSVQWCIFRICVDALTV